MTAKHVQSYIELDVSQLSIKVETGVFLATKTFPREEMFSLTDQARRSSRAIGAAIAEAWGKRRYVAHFISKLTDADAEQLDTQHWITVAQRCGYLNHTAADELLQLLQRIGTMLHAMMERADAFCLRVNAASDTDH